MIRIRFSAITLSVILFGAMVPSVVQAQMVCTGPGCAALPIPPSRMNDVVHEFQSQYTNTLFNDMAEAATLSSLTGIPVGTVNLRGYTFGASAGAGYLPEHKVDVQIPDVGTFHDVPVAGVAITPRLFFGFNLGRLFGMDYDPFAGSGDGSGSTPKFYSPSRFDIYLSGISVGKNWDSSVGIKGKLHASLQARGIEVRYHLMEGNNIAMGPMLRFLGVSLGAGMNKTKQTVDYLGDPDRLTMTPAQGSSLFWAGRNSMNWRSNIDTYPVELRSGLQLLYFINWTVGGGVAFNKGTMDFDMSRMGPAGLVTSYPLYAGYTPGSTIPGTDAYLSMMIQGKGSVPARMPYARTGIEFNLMYLKLSFEALATKRSYGANIGVRIEI